MARFDLLAFDADDTLWHTERLYADAQAQFRRLLARYHDLEWINEQLYQTEMHNMQHFGYGILGFNACFRGIIKAIHTVEVDGQGLIGRK